MIKKINIGLFICAMICLIYYDFTGGIWLKGVTSSWFVILGLVNVIYARNMKVAKYHFLILMELGLIFGMCADVLLGVEFISGVLIFAVGHMFYMIAFYSLEKFAWKDICSIVPITLISLLLVVGTPYIQVEDPFIEKLLIAYAIIISCMLGKSVSNFIENKSVSRRFLLIGSIMFWFSDLVLAIRMFGDGGELMGRICTYTYWPAQNILALSLYVFVNENKDTKKQNLT